MVLDPFTALGLAGNIVQFVDFLCKLLSESRSLYESSTGASDDNIVLEKIANDLSLLTSELTTSSSPAVLPASSELLETPTLCKQVAAELSQALDELKVKGPHKKWKSFVQALRSVMKKEQIQALARRLDTVQRQLNTRLLVLLSSQQSDVSRFLNSLYDENKRLEMTRGKQLQQLKSELQATIMRLRPEAPLDDTTVQGVMVAIQRQIPVNEVAMEKMSENMQTLSARISALAEQSRLIASEQVFLKSLRFKLMKVRQENIVEAHAKTFDWVFDDAAEVAGAPIKFHEWLRSQSGIYWIMGKAGSGKSTLMKFLYSDRRTMNALQSWAGQKKLVTANFFFWNPGTRMQKSQEGLIRSLLYEIFRQCANLIPIVCPLRWAASSLEEEIEPEPWTLPELLETLNQLLQQSEVPARICFFIDGLDEYDGDHPELINILKGFPVSPDIKICISSRP